MESNEEINYASSSLRRRYSGRNNSFKSSPILKSGLRFRSRKSSATGSAESSPIVTAYKPVTDPSDLRKLPLLHELAFMVAIEASRDVKESWDAVVKEYCDAESKTTEVIMIIQSIIFSTNFLLTQSIGKSNRLR